MSFPRSSGILLHPTSLPGRFGIGDLGSEAYAFADFLVDSGQSLWQVLPLGPTGYGDSPYACYSAFAGNTLLISPERLFESGLISISDLDDLPSLPTRRVDFAAVAKLRPYRGRAKNFTIRSRPTSSISFFSSNNGLSLRRTAMNAASALSVIFRSLWLR